MITKNTQRVGTDPTQVFIDLKSPDGQQTGLRIDSSITCGNLHTVHEKHIIATIGKLSVALTRKVNDCLKKALELP